MDQKNLTTREVIDQNKTKATTQGAAFSTFHAALVAAQTSMAASAVTVAADGGAAGGTKTAVAATAVLVAALSDAALNTCGIY